MRKAFILIIAVLVGGMLPSAPAVAGQGAFVGTILGASFGGLFGSMIGRGAGNVAATTTGLFLGGLTGNVIGQSFDDSDRRVRDSSYSGSYADAPGFFSDPPPEGNIGGPYEPNYVAPPDPPSPPPPPPAYQGYVNGMYCREYSQTVSIGGRIQVMHGFACQQPDGSWRVMQ